MRYTSTASARQNSRATRSGSAAARPTERSPPHRMFDTLSERLRKTLADLTGRGRVSEADVDAAMREIRLSLLEADVNFKVVKDFIARVRERAVGADDPGQPDRRPAGRRDRPRGADRAPVGRRSDVPPPGQPGGRAGRRPAGLGQDDDRRQARPPRRQARPSADARRRRPVPPERRRPARDARREPRSSRSTERPTGRRSSISPGPASRPPGARSATPSSSTPRAG